MFSGGDVQVQEEQPVFENVELQPFPSLSVLKQSLSLNPQLDWHVINGHYMMMPSDGETPITSFLLEHKAQIEPRNCLSLWLVLELTLLVYGWLRHAYWYRAKIQLVTKKTVPQLLWTAQLRPAPTTPVNGGMAVELAGASITVIQTIAPLRPLCLYNALTRTKVRSATELRDHCTLPKRVWIKSG